MVHTLEIIKFYDALKMGQKVNKMLAKRYNVKDKAIRELEEDKEIIKKFKNKYGEEWKKLGEDQ